MSKKYMSLLRKVTLRPYAPREPYFVLTLIDTKWKNGRDYITYRFEQKQKGFLPITICEGDDFGCSPIHCVDADETVASLLHFLTLRKGDTDSESFEALVSTPAHKEFSETHTENVSGYVYGRFGE